MAESLDAGFEERIGLHDGPRGVRVHGFDHQQARLARFAVTGRAGGMLKEAVCRLTMRWLRQERDRAGSYSWPAPAVEGIA